MNPLLNRARIPGATFRMPSGGLFYVNGELEETVVDGEVHVFPMTSIDEIELKSPDLLFSGKAIENVFKRCIPQIKEPMRLITTDVDFLLVCLRLVSYGPAIEVSYTHTCNNAQNHKYSGSVETFIHQARMMRSADYDKEYLISHSTGVTINIIPMRYGDFVKYMTEIQEEVSTVDAPNLTPKELLFKEATRMAENISCVQVDDIAVTDKSHIADWIISLSVAEVKEITDKFRLQTEWGCDTKIRATCQDCKEEIEVPVSINPIDFFTWS